MKHKLHILLSIVALGSSLLLTGCVLDDIASVYKPGKLIDVTVSTGVMPVLTLVNDTLTRANGDEPAAAAEVYDYYLFQFDENDVLLATPVYVKTGNDPLQIVQLTTSGEKEHRIVAIANLGTDTYPWKVTKDVTTYAQLCAQSITLTNADAGAFHTDGKDYPMMSADWQGVIKQDNKDDGLITLGFSLNVAKLSVTLANTSGSGVVIERITLVNIPSKLSYTAALNKQTTDTISYASVPPYTDEIEEDGSFTHTFYLPANPQPTATDIGDITRLNRYAPPRATYVQLIVRETSSGNRYTTSLHVGDLQNRGDNTVDFDFDIARNTAYSLHYTISDKNDYFLDGRTDPYLSTNNYCTTAGAGSGGYIRTGISPGKAATESIRYEIEYAINARNVNNVLMGSGAAGNTAGTYMITSSTTKAFYAGTGPDDKVALITNDADPNRHTDVFEIDLTTNNVKAFYDGKEQSAKSITGKLGMDELFLFANNVGGMPSGNSNIKLYRFKLWIDGMLVRDMQAVPADAFTTIDGEPVPSSGMYDNVTQALFTSATSPLSTYVPDKPFMFSVDTRLGTSSTDKTYTVPFNTISHAFDFSIQWGDGTQTDYPAGTQLTHPLLTHTYPIPGVYMISVFSSTGEMPHVNFGSNSTNAAVKPATANNNYNKLIALHNEMLYINSTDFFYMFFDCVNLAGVLPEALFSANPQITRFDYLFNGCEKLTYLPPKLFANNKSVTNFNCTFFGCAGFTGEIPVELFANQPFVTSFHRTFWLCTGFTSIPSKLFANNPAVNTFLSCFCKCAGLKSIPAGLFDNNTKVLNGQELFRECSGLEGAIPEGLFANWPLVTDFSFTFGGCTNLKGPFPKDLFAHNPNVTTFSNTFNGCKELDCEIPKDLFANNPNVLTFANLFNGCEKLKGTIPSELFASHPLVMDFNNVFRDCKCLTGISDGQLFANCKLASNFTYAFYGSGIQAIPKGLFDNNGDASNFSYTFASCTKLSTALPAGLFAKCPKVNTFLQTFIDCAALTGTIPADLFGDKPILTNYQSTFQRCALLEGPIPSGLFDGSPAVTTFYGTFNGCNSLNGPIPKGLFDHCPNVIGFYSTFVSCSIEGPIPEGLFDKNTEVESFQSTFLNCSKLTGSIPVGLFANNLKVTSFESTFNGVPDIQLTSTIFVKDENDPAECAKRFSSVAEVKFTNMFACSTRNKEISRGIAPQLWDRSLYAGNAVFTSTSCFGGTRNTSPDDNKRLENYSDIPTTWGGSKQP